MAGFSNAVYREIFKNETNGKEDSEMIVFYPDRIYKVTNWMLYILTEAKLNQI